MTTPLRGLERLPRARNLHHWADYVELWCLADPDRAFSTNQLVHLMRQGEDLGEDEVAHFDGSIVDVADVLNFIEDESLEPQDPPLPPPDDAASAKDRDTFHALTVFEHLAYRAQAFGASYPFSLASHNLVELTSTELTPLQETYLYLLLCSNLRYLDKQSRHPLTTTFEIFSLRSFRRCVPAEAEVHVFGTAAGEDSRYRGNIFRKISLLADDLRLRLLVDEAEFAATSTGDEGLDLVGWLELPGNSKGLPIALAQCTVRRDWRGKQHDVSDDRWGEILHLSSPIQSMTFIPYCFHAPGGDWEVPHEVHRGVLIDRLRALHLVADELTEAATEVPYNLVRDAFAIFQRDIPSKATGAGPVRGMAQLLAQVLRRARRFLPYAG